MKDSIWNKIRYWIEDTIKCPDCFRGKIYSTDMDDWIICKRCNGSNKIKTPHLLTDEEIKEKYPSYVKFDENKIIITFKGSHFKHTKKEFYKMYRNTMSGLKDICPTIFEEYIEALNHRSIDDKMGEFEFYQKWLHKYLFGDKE